MLVELDRGPVWSGHRVSVLAGDGLGQALGRARTGAWWRWRSEVLGTQLGHEVLPERRSTIGQ